jgi:hypothetical protein
MSMKNSLSEAETKRLLEAPITVDDLAELERIDTPQAAPICVLSLLMKPERLKWNHQRISEPVGGCDNPLLVGSPLC